MRRYAELDKSCKEEKDGNYREYSTFKIHHKQYPNISSGV